MLIMMELKERSCVIYNEGDKALGADEISLLKIQLTTEWKVHDNQKLSKEFPFESYKLAMAFVQEIALIAEKENHHPDICVYYTRVKVELTTHDVGGLSENDFIMAAKIEDL
jgi:4a-hydroxytetrahydrobiopterin dehydratase